MFRSRIPFSFLSFEKVHENINRPDHNSFVRSEDGKDDIMFCHASQYDEIGGNPLYTVSGAKNRRRLRVLHVTYLTMMLYDCIMHYTYV